MVLLLRCKGNPDRHKTMRFFGWHRVEPLVVPAHERLTKSKNLDYCLFISLKDVQEVISFDSAVLDPFQLPPARQGENEV
jgi:hypothetical protein